jgi:UDP-glucose 4-epimerase
MKILVTGGLGFIGSHTVVSLHEAGFSPVIVDNLYNSNSDVLNGIEGIIGAKIPFHQLDCNDKEAMKALFAQEQFGGVIHFAAYKAVGESVHDPLKYYENNLVSLLILLRLCREFSVSNIVFSSSCTVYGEPDVLPVTEATPRKPATSPYGNTKAIGEDILRDFIASKPDLKAISLRYFNPIGAHHTALIGELPSGVPSNLVPFITQTAAGIRPELQVFGDDYNTPDGTCIRDFIHVVDLANAHVKALNKLINEATNYYNVYNVGTGKGYSVMELILAFERVTGVPFPYRIVPRRAGDVEQIYAQVDKANTELGWTAAHSMEEGLQDAWRWQQRLS